MTHLHAMDATLVARLHAMVATLLTCLHATVATLVTHLLRMLRWYNMSARYGCYVGCTSARHGLAKKLGKLECKDFLAASTR